MHPTPSPETIARNPIAELSYRAVAIGVGVPFALGRRLMRGPRVPDLAPLAAGVVRLGVAPLCYGALLGWRIQGASLRCALRQAARLAPR